MVPLALLLLLIPFALPIASLIAQARMRRRMAALEEQSALQKRQIEALAAELEPLQREARPSTAEPAAAKPPAPLPALRREPAGRPPPRQPEAARPPPQATVPALTPMRPPTRQEEPGPGGTPEAEVEMPPPRPDRVQPAPPERPRAGVHPAPMRAATTPPRAPFDWEQLIGVRMFSAVAGIALVLAAVFFLRYSIDRGWLSAQVRVTIGLLTGIGILVVCDLKAARRYPVTANALDAAAIAILFSTFFAAHALWNLISGGVAFGMLALVTAVAVLLSIRRDSLFIAVLGLLGGFATPILLSTGENRPVPLFAYVLLLNVGLAWVAHRKKWPLLTILTFVFTALYQWGWVLQFLSTSAEQIPLAMGIFIVFAICGFVGLTIGRGTAGTVGLGAKLTLVIEQTGVAAAIMPLFFAVFLAAVPAYGARAELLFGFLVLIDAALLAVALGRREGLPHAIGAGATILVFAVWLAVSYAASARVTATTFAAALVTLYALAPMVANRLGRSFAGSGAAAIYASPILLFVFAVIAGIDPAAARPLGLFAPLIGLLTLITWRALATEESALYFVAVFFVVAAEAVWSAMYLRVERLPSAIVLYSVLAIFQIGVPIAARRIGRGLRPAWGGGAVLIASLYLMFFLSAGPRSATGLWGLALLLAILNAGLFVESAFTALPVLSIVGGILSWLALAVWWGTAAVAVGLLPSLLVVAGLTLVMLAGHAWAHARAGRIGFERGLWLGLVGHLFLFFVTLRPEWAMPPWPLLGALVVLTLAVSAASLSVGASQLHAAGAAASAIIVFGWAQTASVEWTAWMLIAAEATVAYALAWQFLVRRRGPTLVPAIGSTIVLFVAELTLISASAAGSVVPFPLVPITHAINLSIILWLAWRKGWRWVAPATVVPAWLASFVWRDVHPGASEWRPAFILPLTLYAVFTAYPFVLGQRARRSRDPYLTAIAGSVFFFFTARVALLQGGLGGYLGVVPVFEGACLALLLRKLLEMEPTGNRDLGRLALVAGSALGFATVAIPLQLSHQWITIGWALEGAALAWTYRRIPHRGLLLWATALFAAAFARLTLNPQVFLYEPRGNRVFNWYLYAYLICGAAFLMAGWWLRATDDRLAGRAPRVSTLLPAAGVVVLFLLLNIEIADFYATGPAITFRFGVTLAQDLTYTIGWLLFGLVLLAIGIYLHNRPSRVAAVALIAITACKGFLYDMGSLGGLYRVGSLVGLAIALSLVALALQKFVLRTSEEHA